MKTKGYRAKSRCPLCGYYDHGGKKDEPRCVGFETEAGYYCSQVESNQRSKNAWGVNIYFWSKSEIPGGSPSLPLPSPPLPLGFDSSSSSLPLIVTPEETELPPKEAAQGNLNTILTKEKGLPGGFCGYHKSHFCPCTAPSLYEKGFYINSKKEEVKWQP